MKAKRLIRAEVVALALSATFLLLPGCTTDVSNSRVLVPVSNAAINGQPLRVTLDTGSGYAAFLTTNAVERLGIRFTPTPRKAATAPAAGLTEAVNLTMGAENFAAQFAIFDWDGFDLLIGWPAIQDNILVFDGTTHTVNAVAELPKDTADWFEAKIRPVGQGQVLLLEIPLGNDGTGTVMIDTGDPGGVTVPEAAWKQWSDAHPRAQVEMLRETVGSSAVSHTVPSTQAEEIKLGPLTLTDVPLRETGDIKVYGDVGDNFAGSIGLAALARMDMVVDGKNSVAYLRPKPNPGGGGPSIDKNADAGAARPNWTVKGSLQLKSDVFILTVAEYKVNAEDYGGAIADCSRAIELDPNNAYAWTLRAVAKQDNHDLDGAMADIDHALELDPKNNEATLLRAVAAESMSEKGGTDNGASPAAASDLSPSLLDAMGIAKRLGTEMNNGDYKTAIADINALIAYNPSDSTGLYLMRGVAWQGTGEGARALADFNHEIQLNPRNASGYFWRGVEWQIRGEFAHALADFNKSEELQTDFDSRLLDQIFLSRQFLQYRLDLPTNNFATNVDSWKDGWEKTLGQFVSGKLDEAALLAAAESPGDTPTPVRQREADYYIGLRRLLNGDKNGARTNFQECVAGDAKLLEFTSRFARAELGRLEAADKK